MQGSAILLTIPHFPVKAILSMDCCELYHCTLDVCTINKVHKYRLYVQDRWLACILLLRHNNKYFVKYQNIVLEMQWTELSMEDVS
jgi:hypothetical protein